MLWESLFIATLNHSLNSFQDTWKKITIIYHEMFKICWKQTENGLSCERCVTFNFPTGYHGIFRCISRLFRGRRQSSFNPRAILIKVNERWDFSSEGRGRVCKEWQRTCSEGSLADNTKGPHGDTESWDTSQVPVDPCRDFRGAAGAHDSQQGIPALSVARPEQHISYMSRGCSESYSAGRLML